MKNTKCLRIIYSGVLYDNRLVIQSMSNINDSEVW